jgi:hypothetical protein
MIEMQENLDLNKDARLNINLEDAMGLKKHRTHTLLQNPLYNNKLETRPSAGSPDYESRKGHHP